MFFVWFKSKFSIDYRYRDSLLISWLVFFVSLASYYFFWPLLHSLRKMMRWASTHRKSKPCSVQPACEANHATSRRCWRLLKVCSLLRLCALVAWRYLVSHRPISDAENYIVSSLFGIGIRDHSSKIVFLASVIISTSMTSF